MGEVYNIICDYLGHKERFRQLDEISIDTKWSDRKEMFGRKMQEMP